MSLPISHANYQLNVSFKSLYTQSGFLTSQKFPIIIYVLKVPDFLNFVLAIADLRITIAIVPFRDALVVAGRGITLGADDFTVLVILLQPWVEQHVFAGDSFVGITTQQSTDNAASLGRKTVGYDVDPT